MDGTGSSPFVADVAVDKGQIVTVSDLSGVESDARQDATGKYIAPGFIDVHTHDDRVLLSSPDMTNKISQGVTTVVTGNCGISLAPFSKSKPIPPMNLIGADEWYRFDSVSDYISELDAEPAAVNSAMLVGHTTLRVQTMDRVDRPATKSERLQMERIADKAMADGCIGLSTGLEYPPAISAPPEEVLQLAKCVAVHGGIYTTHMRDEADGVRDSIDETIEVADKAKIRTIISHHKVCGKNNWGRTSETLQVIEAAQKKVDITFDVYPYIASSTTLLQRFVDRAERILVTWSDPYPEFAGVDLSVIVDQWGIDVVEAIDRLSPAGAIYFQMNENDLHRVLKFPGGMIGSDGLPSNRSPHPRLWGTFPRVLGHYCRDLGLFPIEEAVSKMTGISAKTFGLNDRGVIREGMQADIVVFDPDVIIDKAKYGNPMQASAGIEQVYVNGELSYTQHGWTGARSGRFIRRH